jgi:hypothetical protein
VEENGPPNNIIQREEEIVTQPERSKLLTTKDSYRRIGIWKKTIFSRDK